MMPLVEAYDKSAQVIGFRHVEWNEEARAADYPERSAEIPVERGGLVCGLAARLRALVHPAPTPQTRRRHA